MKDLYSKDRITIINFVDLGDTIHQPFSVTSQLSHLNLGVFYYAHKRGNSGINIGLHCSLLLLPSFHVSKNAKSSEKHVLSILCPWLVLSSSAVVINRETDGGCVWYRPSI